MELTVSVILTAHSVYFIEGSQPTFVPSHKKSAVL